MAAVGTIHPRFDSAVLAVAVARNQSDRSAHPLQKMGSYQVADPANADPATHDCTNCRRENESSRFGIQLTFMLWRLRAECATPRARFRTLRLGRPSHDVQILTEAGMFVGPQPTRRRRKSKLVVASTPANHSKFLPGILAETSVAGCWSAHVSRAERKGWAGSNKSPATTSPRNIAQKVPSPHELGRDRLDIDKTSDGQVHGERVRVRGQNHA